MAPRRAVILLTIITISGAHAAGLGRVPLLADGSPAAWRRLNPSERKAFDLGRAVFNTSWVVAGTPSAENHDGLGPLFNVASCDQCHNGAAAARRLPAGTELPLTVVVQLTRASTDDTGDPTYGHELSPAAIKGETAEGQVEVTETAVRGHYADGTPWTLKAPHYSVVDLAYGPLAPDTVVSVRVAPALYGVGLLDLVPASALEQIAKQQAKNAAQTGIRGSLRWRGAGRQKQLGRLGWQDVATSAADQTARALSRDMGLTNPRILHDDCTSREDACLHAANGGTPEVSPELFRGLLAYEASLGVPELAKVSPDTQPGYRLFMKIGCGACHRPTLPVALDGTRRFIHPYTDLLLHYMGSALSDHTIDGAVVNSRWRTTPLWGLGVELSRPGGIALLHDGRTDNVAGAVLWHGGEAASARNRFEHLPESQRRQLLDWIGQL